MDKNSFKLRDTESFTTMKRLTLLSLSFACFLTSSYGQSKRIFHFGGLVVDQQTFAPITNATIYDEHDQLLASTDSRGYFIADYDYYEIGDLHFLLKIQKEGYKPFLQKEHWGNFPSETNALFCFALATTTTEMEGSSAVDANCSSISYEATKTIFEEMKTETLFATHMENAKRDNSKIFLSVDGGYYIANNSSWIPISSPNDSISINGEETLPAYAIDEVLQRQEIRGMTTVASKTVACMVFTVKNDLYKKYFPNR